MKIITYTKLREDLASLLDSLRDGESIVVTQRGCRSIVLSAANLPEDFTSESGGLMKKMQQQAPISEHFTSVISEGFGGGVAQKIQKLSFEEAKERTRIKHAEIIKALEDK